MALGKCPTEEKYYYGREILLLINVLVTAFVEHLLCTKTVLNTLSALFFFRVSIKTEDSRDSVFVECPYVKTG